MSGRTASTRVRTEKLAASIPLDQNRPLSPARATTADQLLQRKYRQLTRKHLGRLLKRLFADFTGLHFHVAWAPAASLVWDSQRLPTAGSLCCRSAGAGVKGRAVCRVCGPQQLARALTRDGDGLSFSCRLGVWNYWLPIRVRRMTLGIAYLQAFHGDRARSLAPQSATRAATKTLGRPEFHRASRLLRLMIQHVQTLDLAELRKADLTNAGRAVLALEKEQARLHEAIQRHLPAPPQVARRAAVESRAEGIVHDLLTRLDQDYARPTTLREYADELALNATYLSALFSRIAGRPFKAYLTGLRMEKAKELLGDPSNNVSEIADLVGYASENRFRLAFKKTTGLAPKVWRETMQTNPPPSP